MPEFHQRRIDGTEVETSKLVHNTANEEDFVATITGKKGHRKHDSIKYATICGRVVCDVPIEFQGPCLLCWRLAS